MTPPANDDEDDEEDGYAETSASTNRFYPNQLTGIDYSEASIKLAQGVAQQRRDKWRRKIEKAKRADKQEENGQGEQAIATQEEEECGSQASEEEDEDYDSDEETLSPVSLELDDPLITTSPLFITGDLLTFRNIRDLYSSLPKSRDQVSQSMIDEPWDLVMDKGTFDALALSQDTVPVPSHDGNGDETVVQMLPSAVYPGKVAQLVKKGGYFLITCTCRETVRRRREVAFTLMLFVQKRVISPSKRSRAVLGNPSLVSVFTDVSWGRGSRRSS